MYVLRYEHCLTQWKLNSFEFKFDDTRLSSLYKNKIGPIKKKCCILTLLCLCPVGCFSLVQLNWESQQGRDIATSGRNNLFFNLANLFLYIMMKVWYHQIRIQNNLGFMVLILMSSPNYNYSMKKRGFL